MIKKEYLFMKKRVIPIILALLTLISLSILVSCDEDGDDGDTETVAVTGITLDKASATLSVGQSCTLIPTVTPENATDKSVVYTVTSSAVATVSGNGTVTAVSPGITTVTATTVDGGFSASCTVTVNAVPVSAVTLSKSELTLNIGATDALTASITPENATNKTLIWSSSDESVVRVSQTGNIDAVARGTATVTVKTADGDFTSACVVTVTARVTGVTLSKGSLSLGVGASETLTASIAPATADNQAVSWSSSDTSVASVDQNGRVTAHKKGSAVISVITADGVFTASCSVTVTVAVTGVTLNQTSASVYIGDTLPLTPTVTPSGAAKTVSWSSSAPAVATVDIYGRVTAKSAGSAIITVTTAEGGFTAKCTVTVSERAVTDISLNKTALALDNGTSETLICTVTPANATNKSISWSTSNPAVAEVTAGKVTAIGVGVATITARSANGRTAVCTVKTVLVPASGTVKDGVTTTFWQATDYKRVDLPSVTDLSDNDHLVFKVYSEKATGNLVQLRFSQADSDRRPGQGMAPYYRYLFTVDFTGWKEFHIDIHDLKSNYSPSFRYISYINFDYKGWEMDAVAPNPDTKLYFTDIAFVKSDYETVINGNKTEAEYIDEAKDAWKTFLNGNGAGISSAYRSRVASIEEGAIKAWKTYSFSYEKTFVGTGTDKAHTLFKISYASDNDKKYGNEGKLGTLYTYIQMMAQGYSTKGTSTYKDPALLQAIKNCLEYAFNNYYGESHLTDAAMQQWVKDTNWWWWEIGIPSYVVDILMMLHDDLTQAEINRYLIPVDYFVPRVKYTACNRLWVGKIAYASAILKNDAVKALITIEDLHEIFDYVTVGDGFYEDGSFIQHGKHPYTGGYGSSMLFELSQFILCLDGTAFRFPAELLDRHYDWLFNTFEPVMYRSNVMASIKGREAARSDEKTTFTSLFSSFARAAYYSKGETKDRLEAILKYFLVNNDDSIITSNINLGILDYVTALETDPTVTARSGYEIHKVFGSMDRIVQHRPDYSVSIALSSTRIYKYEAINEENKKGWYQGDGMIYIYTPGYDFSNTFFTGTNAYKMPGTTVTSATRVQQNLSGGILGSSDFAGGVGDGKYGVAAFILGYAQNDYFNTNLAARKSYFTFDDEIVCIGSGISESTTGSEIYTTVENRLWRSGDTFKVDGVSAEAGSTAAKYAHFTNMGGYVFDGSDTVSYTKNGSYLEMTVSHGVRPTNGDYFFVYLPGATENETKAYSDNMSSRITVISATNAVHAVRDNDIGVTGYVFYEAATCNGVTASAPCTVMISGNEVSVSDPTHKLTSLTLTVNGRALTFDLTGNTGNTYTKTL